MLQQKQSPLHKCYEKLCFHIFSCIKLNIHYLEFEFVHNKCIESQTTSSLLQMGKSNEARATIAITSLSDKVAQTAETSKRDCHDF